MNGYWGLTRPRTPEAETPKALAAIEAYEKEFPHGRYAAEMRLWRGALALDRREWVEALTLLNATLDDREHRDLQVDAAMNLADTAEDHESIQDIRAAMAADKSLSAAAKEVTIVARNGRVWLRGHVSTAEERSAIERAALQAAGVVEVHNELVVAE